MKSWSEGLALYHIDRLWLKKGENSILQSLQHKFSLSFSCYFFPLLFLSLIVDWGADAKMLSTGRDHLVDDSHM